MCVPGKAGKRSNDHHEDKMTPLLSVITISYQDPTGLKETCVSLQPLLEQKISWEHIIVDSSPEQNFHFFSNLPQSWPLVHLKELPQGIYAAMNSGLKKATSKYFWFLNGGDRLKDFDALKKIISMLNDNSHLDMICASGDLMRNGKFLYVRSPRATFLKSILGKDFLCHQATLYRSEVFKKVGLFLQDYKIASDYEHFWRCYTRGIKVKCINVRLALCDLDGISTSSWKTSIQECRKLTENIKPALSSFLYFRHRIGMTLEILRLYIIKFLAQTPLSKTLRPLWFWWNRQEFSKK